MYMYSCWKSLRLKRWFVNSPKQTSNQLSRCYWNSKDSLNLAVLTEKEKKWSSSLLCSTLGFLSCTYHKKYALKLYNLKNLILYKRLHFSLVNKLWMCKYRYIWLNYTINEDRIYKCIFVFCQLIKGGFKLSTIQLYVKNFQSSLPV